MSGLASAAAGRAAGSGRVGVGVIGAGNISTQYLTNLTSFPDVEVRFIADIDLDRAQFQAQAFGVARFGTVEQLLADPEIEIVVNLTIPKVHAEVAQQVLAAGKHVWTEKPIALDRESGRALLTAARAAGLRVATAPDTFLGAGIQTARRLIESGAIGEAKTALTLMQQPGPESWHPNPDFLFQEGAGPLFDVGPYYVTTLIQLFGPVKRVAAVASTSKASRTIGSGPRAGESFEVTVPTHVTAVFEFERGQTSQSIFSFDSQIRRTLFEVTGVDGALELVDPNMFVGDLVLHKADGSEETIATTGEKAARGTGVVELARAIRAGVPERASGEQAFHALDVMVSTIEAAESGEWVEVGSSFVPTPALPETWSPSEATL
ncbi:Gfo/Idh/MocA family protein [Gryllotalpicola protaetiae]|uniref:Gfo/Idh/MocA family oxidoreductase n=1 Tax=Gryllotalpicola protaetiae TaxID=2419771 RepID=A0A387BIV1_9MICO|nr:Gfo/Idh/MocA family oxidoreductase [Gryllotalpicola protaetiae]AYG04015.1 gfo/Idh/MocA family oxidoreductase [Gryllotalpicola protaetiae]